MVIEPIIPKIIEFVRSCPYIDEYNIDFGETGVAQFIDTQKPSSAVEYVGSNVIELNSDVRGNHWVKRQANIQLLLLSKTNDNKRRELSSEFCYAFEQWMDEQSHLGTAPKIGDVPDEEYWFADNAMQFAPWENESDNARGLGTYVIQIHIIFIKQYIV